MEIKQKSRIVKKKGRKELPLAFTKINFLLLAAGVLFLIAGNIALAQMPVMGTVPLVIAPILLVIGYCVIIPAAIFFRKKGIPTHQEPPQS